VRGGESRQDELGSESGWEAASHLDDPSARGLAICPPRGLLRRMRTARGGCFRKRLPWSWAGALSSLTRGSPHRNAWQGEQPHTRNLLLAAKRATVPDVGVLSIVICRRTRRRPTDVLTSARSRCTRSLSAAGRVWTGCHRCRSGCEGRTWRRGCSWGRMGYSRERRRSRCLNGINRERGPWNGRPVAVS
jgi:hypothetical protein